MDNLPIKYHDWSDRLAMDMALMLEHSGESLAEVMSRHGIVPDDIYRFNADPVFLRKVRDLRDEIREKGMTFRLKARAQAEELLTTSWALIHSSEVSASVKADLIKSTVKWGNLEPRPDSPDGAVAGGVSIMINLGERAPQLVQASAKVLEHDPPQ